MLKAPKPRSSMSPFRTYPARHGNLRAPAENNVSIIGRRLYAWLTDRASLIRNPSRRRRKTARDMLGHHSPYRTSDGLALAI